MSRWWRAYDEAVDDPKLCLLTDKQHRAWFNLCCITSQNGGKLPAMAAVAFKLRMTVDKARAIVAELVALGLVDLDPETGGAAPHNWGARQYQSDTSTERVKRFRNGGRNVSETVNETTPEQKQITDTDQIKESRAVVPTRPDEFEDFWKAYPKRDGANPKAPARKAFLAALKAGATAAEIIAGTQACAAKDRDKIGTPYIPQAVKWLRDRRWDDYAATGPPEADDTPKGWRPGLPTHEELKRKYAQNGQLSEQVGEVLGGGPGPQPEPQISGRDQARNGRMVQLGSLFSPSRLQALGDDVGRAEPDENGGVHGSGSVA